MPRAGGQGRRAGQGRGQGAGGRGRGRAGAGKDRAGQGQRQGRGPPDSLYLVLEPEAEALEHAPRHRLKGICSPAWLRKYNHHRVEKDTCLGI